VGVVAAGSTKRSLEKFSPAEDGAKCHDGFSRPLGDRQRGSDVRPRRDAAGDALDLG
jgi:hypothetical protein